MGILNFFKERRLRKASKAAQAAAQAALDRASQPKPGIDWGGEKFPPTYGFTTAARPRSGAPPTAIEVEMARKLLFGNLKPKNVLEAKLTVSYEDGEVSEIGVWKGPLRLLILPINTGINGLPTVDYEVVIERSLFRKEVVETQGKAQESP